MSRMYLKAVSDSLGKIIETQKDLKEYMKEASTRAILKTF